ncbi:MAG: response regulator [Deltaproteobacteria bacterium]|nr:MAG: response regulator [Deltaproteobacteria bacterium]
MDVKKISESAADEVLSDLRIDPYRCTQGETIDFGFDDDIFRIDSLLVEEMAWRSADPSKGEGSGARRLDAEEVITLCNHLAANLALPERPGKIFRTVAESLRPFGIELMAWHVLPDIEHLSLVYAPEVSGFVPSMRIRRTPEPMLAALEQPAGSYLSDGARLGYPEASLEGMQLTELPTILHPIDLDGERYGAIAYMGLALRAQDRAALRLVTRQIEAAIERFEHARDLDLVWTMIEDQVRERDRFAALIEGLPEPVALLDEAGQIVLKNPAAERLFDTFFENACDTGDAPGTIATPLERQIEDLPRIIEEICHGRSKLVTREICVGEPLQQQLAVMFSPLHYSEGPARKIDKVIVLFKDITTYPKMEEQIIQHAKLVCIGQMAAGVAHEINNPLMSVLGYTDLLLQHDLPETIQSDLRKIKKDGLRAREIVKNLLAFARGQEEEKAPLDLNEVLRTTNKILKKHFKLDQIEIIETFDPELPKVSGHQTQFQQIFLNLIQNAGDAIKLSGKGSKITVQTRFDRKRERIEVTISDDGPGMSPEVQKKIFTPFFTTKGNRKGTGLGLAITQKIVQNHEGKIHVKSKVGEGTMFRLSFPVCNPAVMAAKDHLPAPSAPLRTETARRARILVIDDETTIVELISRVLSLMGHEVITCQNAREARRALEGSDFDLITLDLKMPDISGQELYEEIRSLRPDLTDRVIFLTGDTMSPDIASFLTESGNPYLIKPFDISEFSASIRAALERE